MKYFLHFTTCILFTVSQSFGQAILSFTEYDEEDRVIMDSLRDISAFDINSRVEIDIDKDLLRKALFDQLEIAPPPDDITNRISVLQDAAQKGIAALVPLQNALMEWLQTPDSLRSINTLQPIFNQIGDPALRIIDLAPAGSRLRKELNRQLAIIPREAGTAGTYNILFEGALREVGLLKNELDDIVKNHGVFIQLGAWLDTRKSTNPIHLPGFDTYDEREQFVVKRWNISLSETQKEQLKSIENLANTFNTISFKQVLSDVKVVTPEIISQITTRFNLCAEKMAVDLDKLKSQLPREEAIAFADIENIESLIRDYHRFLQTLSEKYQTSNFSASSAAFLIQTNDDLTQLKNKTEELVSRSKNLNITFGMRFENTSGGVKMAFDDLAKTVTDCSGLLNAGTKNLVEKAKAVITELTGLKKLNETALALGKAVMKYDIGALPERTSFSITKTGRRQAGDRILVRVAAGDSTGRKQILEQQQFRLFQLLPHIRTIVGLIFANLPDSETVDSKFQLSASYSILLKKGSRKSMGFNRIFSPGIGLNVAALDFDHNDIPEIGLGVVGSVLRDYLQGGFGYNVYRDEPYWFFGLRIPLSLSAITFNRETTGMPE